MEVDDALLFHALLATEREPVLVRRPSPEDCIEFHFPLGDELV